MLMLCVQIVQDEGIVRQYFIVWEVLDPVLFLDGDVFALLWLMAGWQQVDDECEVDELEYGVPHEYDGDGGDGVEYQFVFVDVVTDNGVHDEYQ